MKTQNVAIITRTKNRAILLERAVLSVLDQTHESWIHVVVNDGGDTDEVDRLLSKYEKQYHGRLTIIHNPESVGMEAASNKGINSCESDYVVIHDDDDSWEPEFLETCVSTLEATQFPSVKGVTTHTNHIFESVDANSVNEKFRREFDPNLTSISLPEVTEINKFMPISFLFRRDALNSIGLYDEELPVIGDWEFNIRFISRFDIIVVRRLLANYHVRVDSHQENFANTVTAKHHEHMFYHDLIVNKHIRNDIEAGRISLGLLMAFGDYFHRIHNNTWRLVQMVERLKNFGPLKVIRRLLRI